MTWKGRAAGVAQQGWLRNQLEGARVPGIGSGGRSSPRVEKILLVGIVQDGWMKGRERVLC